MHRQNGKIQPQNRFCEPSRQAIVLIERLYCTIPQSLCDSSLYTREPLPRPIFHPRTIRQTALQIPNLPRCGESSSIRKGKSALPGSSALFPDWIPLTRWAQNPPRRACTRGRQYRRGGCPPRRSSRRPCTRSPSCPGPRAWASRCSGSRCSSWSPGHS